MWHIISNVYIYYNLSRAFRFRQQLSDKCEFRDLIKKDLTLGIETLESSSSKDSESRKQYEIEKRNQFDKRQKIY